MQGLEDLLHTFVVLWAVIDPIGTIPVFIAVTKKYDPSEKSKIAKRAVIISALVLIFFIIVGELILNFVGVPLPAFQISGGIILFLFALSMIFGTSKVEEDIKSAEGQKETAVFPLAMPSIASPGAILAVVLLTDNTRHSISNQVITTFVMLLVLLITWVLLHLSKHIYHYIGNAGASVISRIMGLILASIAANNILLGVKEFFEIV